MSIRITPIFYINGTPSSELQSFMYDMKAIEVGVRVGGFINAELSLEGIVGVGSWEIIFWVGVWIGDLSPWSNIEHHEVEANDGKPWTTLSDNSDWVLWGSQILN